MDTFAIDPTITLIFTVLGGIGSLYIRAAKAFDPKFRIKFDTVFNSEERQAYSLRVGGVLFVVGSACWLVWLWANGQVPTDPREAIVFVVRTAAQSVINLMGLLGGKTTVYENFKHFLSKPDVVSTPTVQVTQWPRATDWSTSVATGPSDAVRYAPGDGAVSYTLADDTTTGGGAA